MSTTWIVEKLRFAPKSMFVTPISSPCALAEFASWERLRHPISAAMLAVHQGRMVVVRVAESPPNSAEHLTIHHVLQGRNVC